MEQQMENNRIPTLEEEYLEQEVDALSLCDLSSDTFDAEAAFEAFDSCTPPEAFEFTADQMEATISSIDSILFCGKSIPFDKPRNFRVYEEQRSRLSLLRSDSFKRQHSLRRLARTNSLRLLTSQASPAPGSSRNSPGSGSGRKYKAIIGVTKFPSKMDMNDIKKRQSRRAPAPLVPAAFDGGEVAVGRSNWGLLRPLRCRSHLVSALARASLGCISHV